MQALRSARADEIVYFGRPPVRVDLFKSLPGVEFGACYGRCVFGEWEGVPVTVIGVDDLIEAKRVSDRPQDRLDVAMLEQARRGP
jgi:hypothetical protein